MDYLGNLHSWTDNLFSPCSHTDKKSSETLLCEAQSYGVKLEVVTYKLFHITRLVLTVVVSGKSCSMRVENIKWPNTLLLKGIKMGTWEFCGGSENAHMVCIRQSTTQRWWWWCDGKRDIASQNATVWRVFPGQPSSKCREMGHNFTCPLTVGSSSYIEGGGECRAARHSVCPHPLMALVAAIPPALQLNKVSNYFGSVTLEVTSLTPSPGREWLIVFQPALRFACDIYMSKHSTWARCDVHTSSIIYVSLWHSVLISALLCPRSAQISAVLSARSPSRGVGSRITCWAASPLLPYHTIVSIISQKWPDACVFKKGWKHLWLLCVCVCVYSGCAQ